MQRVDGNRVYFSSARETRIVLPKELSRRFWLFEATAFYLFYDLIESQPDAAPDKRMSREEPFERIDCYLDELRTIPFTLTMVDVLLLRHAGANNKFVSRLRRL